MQDSISLPLLKEVLPNGLIYGANYFVEFESDSLWYETSLTLVAQALRNGVRTDYHTFSHVPADIRRGLEKLVLNLDELEKDDTFRIIDTYTVQSGLGTPEPLGKATPRKLVDTQSVKLIEWDKSAVGSFSEEVHETDRRRLHIDDNTSILLQYNMEQEFINHWRTISLPYVRRFDLAAVHSIVRGVFSEGFYRQFESFCDGIIDFKSEEESGELEHYLRIRLIRGMPHDSSWRRIRLLDNGEVALLDAARRATPSRSELELVTLLKGARAIQFSKFCVVGNYMRYDEGARNLLKNLKQKVHSGLESSVPKRENYLLWSQPGGGKTFFVQEVVSDVKDSLQYFETNLAKTNEQEFRSFLAEVARSDGPALCFVDEIDSQPGAQWPYEALLAGLDASLMKPARRTFVLAGSSGSSIDEMKRGMASRPKGTDILTRIPHENEYSVPPMTGGDRILVTLANLRQAGKELGRVIIEVEKLALYYAALDSRLTNARQLRELAYRCMERIPHGEDRVKYDNFFDPGDSKNKEFWMAAQPAASDLVDTFVYVED